MSASPVLYSRTSYLTGAGSVTFPRPEIYNSATATTVRKMTTPIKIYIFLFLLLYMGFLLISYILQ